MLKLGYRLVSRTTGNSKHKNFPITKKKKKNSKQLPAVVLLANFPLVGHKNRDIDKKPQKNAINDQIAPTT